MSCDVVMSLSHFSSHNSMIDTLGDNYHAGGRYSYNPRYENRKEKGSLHIWITIMNSPNKTKISRLGKQKTVDGMQDTVQSTMKPKSRTANTKDNTETMVNNKAKNTVVSSNFPEKPHKKFVLQILETKTKPKPSQSSKKASPSKSGTLPEYMADEEQNLGPDYMRDEELIDGTDYMGDDDYAENYLGSEEKGEY